MPEDDVRAAAEDEEWEPGRSRFTRGQRVVALVAAIAVLVTAIATVFVAVQRDGTSVEVFEPRGSGPADLQRFSEAVRPEGTIDRVAPAGPVELAAQVDLVVLGRIRGFRAGRIQVAPPELALPDQRMVSMDVSVEEVVKGELPAGAGGVLEVELGLFRVRQSTPATVAALAPAGRAVALYLRRAEDRVVYELREPDDIATRDERLRWWPVDAEGFLVDDGEGGVVSVLDGREVPSARLADLLPPVEAWPSAERAPALACAAGEGIAGWGAPPGTPSLSAVDPPGRAAPSRWPTLEGALVAFAATVRAFPPLDGPLESSTPAGPGYAVAFESLTNRTIAYHGAAGEVLAVFYANGTRETGWRVEGFSACDAWYQALDPPPSAPDGPT